MKKQLSLLILSITLLSLLSSTYTQAAAESATSPATLTLWQAARKGNLEHAQQAIKNGADINGIPNTIDLMSGMPCNSTPLYEAVSQGKLSVVQFLLSQGALVDAPSFGTITPLLALCNDNFHLHRTTINTIATKLIAHKAQVNVYDAINQCTPLIRAIYTQNEYLTKQLILAGADITATDKYNQPALGLARAFQMESPCLEACLTKGVVVEKLHTLKTALHAAVFKFPDIPIEVLAEKYYNPYYYPYKPAYHQLNKRIATLWTPILEKLKIVKLLIKHNYLPVHSIADITANYLFAEQQ